MRTEENIDQEDDEPSEAVLDNHAKEQLGFTEEDEPGEFEQPLPEVEAASATPSVNEATQKKTLSKHEADGVRKQARNSVYAYTKETMMEGKPGHKSLGEYLKEIACDNVASGTSKLWFKGTGPDSGFWLFIIAPKAKGTSQVQAGYRVTLAFGTENAGEIIMDACAFLTAVDRNGDQLKFEKCNAVKQDGGKFEPVGAVSEFDTTGRIITMDFGKNPFSFEEL
ncbi:hypothetical protein [Agrobacterium vitis]|uniref:hypothetical protein n=1 Tax=Agrobacterium vitis TaxID=373 RepID=UPI0008730FE0|nr:hypothetical protein [Agrobacterium vitis]MUO72907.1 hypothetical protein [Agrobacterium vitis]